MINLVSLLCIFLSKPWLLEYSEYHSVYSAPKVGTLAALAPKVHVNSEEENQNTYASRLLL
jgi:hypothetical protein